MHANDIKSCFHQLKHHPDVMGAFLFVIGNLLFLQYSLTFGSEFSLVSWEPMQRIAEQLATTLFNNDYLLHKHM